MTDYGIRAASGFGSSGFGFGVFGNGTPATYTLSTDEVEADGGYDLTVTSSTPFVASAYYLVTIGGLSCYGGLVGRGMVCSTDADSVLSLVTPVLTIGTHDLTFQPCTIDGTPTGIVTTASNAVTAVQHWHRSGVYKIRNAMPRCFATGLREVRLT